MSGFFSQTFRTIPVDNPGLALYTLALYSPGRANFSFFTYTFPLSPQSVRKEFTAMSAIYDVAGTPAQGGIQRVVDLYGDSPFMFVIEGTTGQQRHSTDGYLFTGRQSLEQILELFTLFAELNQIQMSHNSPDMYSMEFYDYYTQEFWQVVPVGPQGIRQTSQQPNLQYYQLRLAGVKPVKAPIISDIFADQAAQLLIAAQSTVASAVQDLIIGLQGTYI